MELPYIPKGNPKNIGEYSERLNHCVQALQRMKKIDKVDGNVPMTLDKLPAIRRELTRTDSNSFGKSGIFHSCSKPFAGGPDGTQSTQTDRRPKTSVQQSHCTSPIVNVFIVVM